MFAKHLNNLTQLSQRRKTFAATDGAAEKTEPARVPAAVSQPTSPSASLSHHASANSAEEQQKQMQRQPRLESPSAAPDDICLGEHTTELPLMANFFFNESNLSWRLIHFLRCTRLHRCFSHDIGSDHIFFKNESPLNIPIYRNIWFNGHQ